MKTWMKGEMDIRLGDDEIRKKGVKKIWIKREEMHKGEETIR